MIFAIILLVLAVIVFGIDYLFFGDIVVKTPPASEISRELNKTNSTQYLQNIIKKD